MLVLETIELEKIFNRKDINFRNNITNLKILHQNFEGEFSIKVLNFPVKVHKLFIYSN